MYQISKAKIDTEIEICHQQLSYWENQYRNCTDDFYKKSYYRQINRWQAKLEVLNWIKLEGEQNAD